MTVDIVTKPQLRFMIDLIHAKFEGQKREDAELWVVRNFKVMPKAWASKKIDELCKLPNISQSHAAVESLEDGIYKTDGTIYKVQTAVNGSGFKYAKKLVSNGDKARFEMAPGAIRRIKADDKLSLEEAEKHGKLYGWCVRCGRTLTDEESIARGIGPVCAGKW